MERDLYLVVCALLRILGRRRRDPRQAYTDGAILAVFYWAVINDRPVWWACRPEHWPRGLWRGPLPSQSCVSRRLRTESIRRLKARLERLALRREARSVVAFVDGKPLPVGPHSHDRNARWGRATGGKAKGYKLHALRSRCGALLDWRLTPMNGDEREMARRMLRRAAPEGYVLGDANFDSNKLFDAAAEGGAQWVAPRRKGAHRGLARSYQSPSRLRSRDLMENTVSSFGRELHQERNGIERWFGTLTSTGGLLTGLPAWVRTYRRVHAWVQAKLILEQIRAELRARRAEAA
jgi:hypothetical protein